MEKDKKTLERRYEQLFEFYGVQSRSWDMLHRRFNRYVFCAANCKGLIAEYLMWEEFVEDAKKLNVDYYMGIDTFLEEYRNAVYSCINLQLCAEE